MHRIRKSPTLRDGKRLRRPFRYTKCVSLFGTASKEDAWHVVQVYWRRMEVEQTLLDLDNVLLHLAILLHGVHVQPSKDSRGAEAILIELPDS